MGDWQKKAQISEDVVYFPNSDLEKIQMVDEVYIWDLDKTYLDTKFESLKGLLRTATEKAFEKKNVPGTKALVRSLSRCTRSKNSHNEFAIFFITASPPQMIDKIMGKLSLDGVQPMGVFCKDNLQNLKPGSFWRLTQHVGYKLQSLLQLRTFLKDDVQITLFGDDSESDAIIYSLYSDICSRRMDSEQIRKILKNFRVVGSQMDSIFKLQSESSTLDPVEKIYINLADDTDSEYYLKFGRRTLPTFNSFQSSLDLFQIQKIDAQGLVDVATDMVVNYGFTSDQIEKALDDLIRRQVISRSIVDKTLELLVPHKIISEDFEPSVQPADMVLLGKDSEEEFEGQFDPWVPERIDYLHDYR